MTNSAVRATAKISSNRIGGLDALRGIAVLLVVAAHTVSRTLGGGVGVTIFFVLSGFLITSLLLKEQRTSGTLDLRAFYVRRALRLFPALAVVLAVTPILMALVNDPRMDQYGQWAFVAGLYLMDFARAFGMAETPLGHTWSLAVEEQFYLLWPLLLIFLIQRSGGDSRRLAKLVGGVFVVFLAWRVVAAIIMDHSWVAYSLDSSAFALLLGCFLASRRAAGMPLPSGAIAFWAALLVLAAITVSTLVVDYADVANYFVIPAAIAAAVAVSSVGSATVITKIRPLVWFGKLSYGFYLWHFVLLRLEFGGQEIQSMTGRAGLVALSLFIAWLSWTLVEAPCLRLKRHFERAGGLVDLTQTPSADIRHLAGRSTTAWKLACVTVLAAVSLVAAIAAVDHVPH